MMKKTMPRRDPYNKEAVLKNLARRELANGQDKEAIHKLRLQCFTRGFTGILGLARSLRVLDQDGSRHVNLQEFKKGIMDSGFDMNESEIEEMYTRFEKDVNGAIKITDFLQKLRPSMGTSRLEIVDKAYQKLDKNVNGKITFEGLQNVYSVCDNPKYLSGEMSKKELMSEFLKNFEAGAPNPDQTVTHEEFVNYYATVSASIDSDAYFDLALRREYKL